MTIEVTGCHDCPFAIHDWRMKSYNCEHPSNKKEDLFSYMRSIHPSCPLKQSPITIKLKENDTTGVCKEGE